MAVEQWLIAGRYRSNVNCDGPLQPGTGIMSGCNDENTAKHAPLQRKNEGGVFCNDAEWISKTCWLYGNGKLPGAFVQS